MFPPPDLRSRLALAAGRVLLPAEHSAPHPAVPLSSLPALLLHPDVPHHLLAQATRAPSRDLPPPGRLFRVPPDRPALRHLTPDGAHPCRPTRAALLAL